MKISVDLAVCTGHARCQVFAPSVFATDDVEGKVVLLQPDVPIEAQADAMRGAKACPERAISVTDEHGISLWPLSAKPKS